MEDLPIESLLHEQESSSLDFKREQYAFEGASDDEKSELLKDILAFSNAWRRSDAYVLIGVEEVRGGRSVPIGVRRHLDDAKVQQFVNSKTQKPIRFAYHVVNIEGVEIGVLWIPLQLPPFFLRRDFGRLKKDVVYTRHSSSTSTADPDEIIRMAEARFATAETITRSRERARQEWIVVERQALASLSLSFKHRVEMPVSALMNYVEGVRIQITPDRLHGNQAVSLRFRKISDDTDLQSAFRLVTDKSAPDQATTRSVSFWRTLTADEREWTEPTHDGALPERAPNQETERKPRITHSGPTQIETVTMFCDGWAYTSSNKDVWTDPERLACGVDGSIQWRDLHWEGLCETVQDLGRLESIEVFVKRDFDLRPADEFKIVWFTSNRGVFILKLDGFRFGQHEQSGVWSASLTGPELYAHFAEQFVDRRLEELAEPDDDAG